MSAARPRDGFVLLAVLWVLTGATILGFLLGMAARDAQGTAANRVSLARASWIAEGCVERARAAVEEAERGETISDSAWLALDRVIARAPVASGCRLVVTPAGTTLDVNAASTDALRRLFVNAGVLQALADSMAAAIADWRDADDLVRYGGAERDWYERSARAIPRNANLASAQELASVRGLNELPNLDSLLGVEPGRILLSRAALPVLASLPGMTPAALAIVERHRAAGDSTIDLPRLTALAPPDARDALVANIPTLSALVTTVPDAWIIAAEWSDGRPAVTARVELRVVRSGRRLAIVRRVSGP